jgi:predicted outer membrane repeat protein
VNVSTPTTVVGTGTAASCTEQALEAAVSRGGIITFNCGHAATIRITSQKNLRTDIDTVIDGGGEVTLDGDGHTRLFHFESPNFRRGRTNVTFQNITLNNGKATGTPIPEYPREPAQCSRGFYLDGGGAAIWIRDGIMHVINATFQNNQAATPGPDVGGGAIYAVGSLEVIVVQSRFINNSGSNGGAIGSLNSDLTVVNSTFTGNTALGHDGNDVDPQCPENERGFGGNGGSVCIDGGADRTATFCGDTFSDSRSGEGALGGAIFRTPDADRQITIIDQCTFHGNSSPGGGAAYFHNSDLRISKTTFSNNSAVTGGALQADGTILAAVNSTFSNNRSGLAWGVLALFGDEGSMRNCTFVGNQGGFSPVLPDFAHVGIDNSIFLNNVATLGVTACDFISPGSRNVQWPAPTGGGPNSLSGCVWGVTVADPQLSDLAENGGPTRTFLPPPTSAASQIATGCPAADQRNRPRPNPNACTAGSVEIL